MSLGFALNPDSWTKSELQAYHAAFSICFFCCDRTSEINNYSILFLWMRKNNLQCTLCAAKSLRKTPWYRRWFWPWPCARVTSCTAPWCWHEAGAAPGHSQDTQSPQTALQQLHPSPISGSVGRESFPHRVAEEGRQQSRGRSHLGHPKEGFTRLDHVFGCSFVLTPGKQGAEGPSWDVCPSSRVSPTSPG